MFCIECQTPVCLKSLASVEHICHTKLHCPFYQKLWNQGSRSFRKMKRSWSLFLEQPIYASPLTFKAQMTQIERDYDEELAEKNSNADEWRQETVQFIENDKTEVLEAITATTKKN